MDWKPFENKHQGERCFILGNAPSLSDENLSLLKNEKVFICNRGHKAKDIGLDHFDYHVVLDLLFYEDYAKELYEVSEGIKFYPEIVKEYNSPCVDDNTASPERYNGFKSPSIFPP